MKFKFLSTALIAAVLQTTSPAPTFAQDSIGAYLAARQARFNNDFAAAADYFADVLAKDPTNAAIQESAVIAFLALGQIDKAIPLAQQLEDQGDTSQLAQMTLLAGQLQKDELDAVIERIKNDKAFNGPFADGMIGAWTHLGKGDVKTAIERFDTVAKEEGVRSFALYHKALALASVGAFEQADEIFSGEADGPIQRTRRGTLAWVQVMSQLERNDKAIATLDELFGPNFDQEIAALRTRLEAGEAVPFTMIGNAIEGAAEVFYSLGQALRSDTSTEYALLYARLAQYLHPSHIDAILMTAELLEDLERYELATEAYTKVPSDHLAFLAAELGRAEALQRADKIDAAVEVLSQLVKSHPEDPLVHVTAGDLHRQQEDFAKAVEVYDTAVELYDARDSAQWFVHYVRAISHERQGHWDKAEADFRRALELNPDQPQVLNYLGYSLVEQQTKLDEALGMIEQAVKAQPNSGYIVDSLGWVLYRLGRYDEAVGHMERAASLMPVDPVVNDHLGDVLWAVGRVTEAEFQWKRALSFITEDTAPQDISADRVRRKLEVGLDQVLSEEGNEPLKVADDN